MSINEKMTAIASAIREKTGGTDALSLEAMASGVPKVFEAGKKAQHDTFWAMYLDDVMNGGYANYMFAGSCWNSETFFPPAVTIKPKQNMDGIFNRFSWGKTPYIDLAARLEECSCILDFSESAYSTGSLFAYCYVTRLPKLDFTASTIPFDRTFDNARYLETIDELVMPTKEVTFSNIFRNCSKLKNIVITGTIGKNGFDMSPCTVLSRNSILSVLRACNKENAAVTITLPVNCIDGETNTETYIANDTELNTALSNARNNGYTVSFN